MDNSHTLRFVEIRECITSANWTERIFFLLSLCMSIGFIHFDVREVVFAKFGFSISIPSSLGALHNQSLKLFVTELYIICLSVLLACNLRAISQKIDLKNLLQWKNSIGLIVIFMSIGIGRASIDLKQNPMLGVRNAAFVWYLCIPLLIWLLPIRAILLEKLFWIIQIFVFAHLIISNFGVFFQNPFSVYWFPCLGIVAPICYALTSQRAKISYSVLCLIGFSVALSYYQGIQRTTLLGALIILMGLLIFQKNIFHQILLRLVFALFCLCFFVVILTTSKALTGALEKDHLKLAGNPFMKSEADSKGMELFRKQLWGDAWRLFVAKPLLGIGFQKQVVYRIHSTGDQYLPNDGGFESTFTHSKVPSAPISGPHNSYLNALSRMGICGILILLIHVMHLYALFIHRYWAGFLVLFQGMLYAFFNIGLEGPTRSFFLLLAMGLASKLLTKVDQANE